MALALALIPAFTAIDASAASMDAARQGVSAPQLKQAVASAAAMPRLHALIVAHDGVPLVERVFHGRPLDAPVDIKSLSKIVIDTLAGIAIDRGVLRGPEQPVLPLLRERVPGKLDARVAAITLDDLLSMRSGLERTSGPFYGQWVNSRNWVRFVLTRPFVDAPGGMMLYSTGNTHLLSAILTDASGRSTWQLANDWIGRPLGFQIPRWIRDPQGIYLGGNEMTLSARSLLKLGELYRLGGLYRNRRILPERWVREAWTPRTTDLWGHGYGYGWFISQADGQPVYFGWGFGGQMLYVVPSLELTVVIISDPGMRSVEGDYVCSLHELLARQLIPAFLPSGAARRAGADPSAADSLCGSLVEAPVAVQ
jgi:CubicO group peptidase (beta-lactamase class C family)